MSRNKHPEETVEKILQAAFKLFQEQGYDHTTIQDIVNAVGLSKGAVYHHFTSKEDILDKISDRYYEGTDWFGHIRENSSLTGLEKLRHILIFQFTDEKKLELDQMSIPLAHNPPLLALSLNASIHHAAPFCKAFLIEGIADGSIQTQYPKELSEAFLLLMNIWVGVYSESCEDFMQKVAFLKQMTDALGMPLINDELLVIAEEYYKKALAPQS